MSNSNLEITEIEIMMSSQSTSQILSQVTDKEVRVKLAVREETVGVMQIDFVKALYTILYDSLLSILGKHNVQKMNKEGAQLI